ncbi:MAG: biotin-dependent carboxyltransferase family protein, partial [Nitrospirales bacterium]
MPRLIQVERPGLLTTVQDLGRVGFQRFGLPVGGAMDRLALRLANRLIGNPDDAAGLEITITGPELTFLRDTVLALTGADLSPRLNDQPLPMWEAVAAPAGARLAFGSRRLGARTYLAVAGGLQIPRVLGSRSTHLR